MPPNNLPEPGEFTRIFKRTHQSPQSGQDAEGEKRIGEVSGIFPAASGSADESPAQAEAAVPPPFAAPPQQSRPPATPQTAQASSSTGEPGEFTQYFAKGLPVKPAQTSNPPAAPQRSAPSGVQRPSTPVPPPQPRNLVTDNSGTFTERFAPKRESPFHRPDDAGPYTPRMGPPPDLSRPTASEENSGFNQRPPLSRRDAPSEFTQLFGSGSLPPPPRQSAVTPPPAPPMMSDSPNAFSNAGERTLRDIPVTASAPPGPSEFTMVSGRRTAMPTSGGDAAATPGNTPASNKMPLPGLNVNLANPTLPLHGGGGAFPGASAHASLQGANVSTPLGNASLHAPNLPPLSAASAAAAAGAKAPKVGDQTKLILFFGILAILAVILVVVLVAMQKN